MFPTCRGLEGVTSYSVRPETQLRRSVQFTGPTLPSPSLDLLRPAAMDRLFQLELSTRGLAPSLLWHSLFQMACDSFLHCFLLMRSAVGKLQPFLATSKACLHRLLYLCFPSSQKLSDRRVESLKMSGTRCIATTTLRFGNRTEFWVASVHFCLACNHRHYLAVVFFDDKRQKRTKFCSIRLFMFVESSLVSFAKFPLVSFEILDVR